MSGINLLPKELKEERKKAQINFRVSIICFSLFLIFILGLIGLEVANQILALTIKTNQTQIQFEEQEIVKLKDIDEKAKEVNRILGFLDNLEKNQILWSRVLGNIAASSPSALQISSLTINSQNPPNFNIQGYAASYREVLKFKEKLETSSYLKNVAFVSSAQTETEKGIIFNFNLQAEIESKR